MLKRISYFFRSLFEKPFKVAFIAPHYLGKPTNAGSAVHANYITREMAMLGNEVHVFAKGDKASKKTEYLNKGKIVYHYVPINFKQDIQKVKDKLISQKISNVLFDNEVINELIDEHSKEDFDVIHSTILMPGVLMTKFFIDVKWFYTVHSLEKNRLKFMTEDEKRYFGIESWRESAMKCADSVIAVSENLKQEILENYNLEEKDVFKIFNGVDLELFKPDNTISDKKQVVFVGRLSLEKGVDKAIRIARQTLRKNKEINFVFVCPSNDEELVYKIPSIQKLQKQLENLDKDYPERVIWHKKPLSREDLAKLYQESMLLIQPSRYESFGMTVLEAMACGKPVITSDRGGLPEVVGNAGFALPLKNYLFADRILELIENFRLRERYSRRAIERAKKFEWKNIAEKTIELYKAKTGNKDKNATPGESIKNLVTLNNNGNSENKKENNVSENKK